MTSATINAAIVHLGAPPTQKQTVSSSLADLGINLLRAQPGDVPFEAWPRTIQLNYSLYRSHIALFMSCAADGVPITLQGASSYKSLDYDGDVWNIAYPSLVISWLKPIPDEVRDSLLGKGWKNGVVKGKPVLIKDNPTIEDARDARETKAMMTTPTTPNLMNIQAFRMLLVIMKIAAVFIKTHQYPAFRDKDHESEYRKMINLVDVTKSPKDKADDEDEEDVEMATDVGEVAKTRKFPINLPVDFDDAPISYDDKNYQKGPGLLFQYFSELAQFDASTTLRVIKDNFFPLLGDEEEEASMNFEALKMAWGNLYRTETGKVLTHFFYCVEIALKTQTILQPIILKKVYCGVLLTGSGYYLKVGERELEPASSDVIDLAMKKASPHSNSLWRILQKLEFQSNDDRVSAYRNVKSMWDLKKLIDTLPITGGLTGQEVCVKDATRLFFPESRPLPISAMGIQQACSYLSDPNKDISTLPYLHHSQLFSKDRVSLVMAAFGGTAFSFMVPSGRQFTLSKEMSITSKNKDTGASTTKAISKIGCDVVPLEIAIAHMKQMIKEQMIKNPFGNSQVRVSDNSNFKIFEKESCTIIVAALRAVAGIKSVTTDAGGKRHRVDEYEDERPSKKGKLFDF